MEAVSAFNEQNLELEPVQLNESLDPRDSMVNSSRQGSDITILPEEIAIISVGSENSAAAHQRREKAIQRRDDLIEQQKNYHEYLKQFFPHDAHVKTH